MRYTGTVILVVLQLVASAQMTDSLFTILKGNDVGVDFVNYVHESSDRNIFVVGMPYLYAGGGVAVEDFNNDGLPDLFFLGNQVPSKLYLNRGGMRFDDVTEEWGVHTQGWCSAVTATDVNGDGYKDLYILKAQNNGEESGGNMLFINVNGERFEERATDFGLDFNGRFMACSFFDFDQDGYLDLFLARYPDISEIGDAISWDFADEFEKGLGTDLLLKNVNNEKFVDVGKAAGIIESNGFALSVITSDINGDGLVDIYVGNDFSEPDHLYINQGGGLFKESLNELFSVTSFFTMGVDMGDLDNDGKTDIVTLDMNPPELSKYKSDFSGFDFSLYMLTNSVLKR
jgi:hypothetical protein